MIMSVPPRTSGVDLYLRGWAIKVKSVSTTVRSPALWFRKKGPYPWDAAVLVLHHPECTATVSIAGWAPKSYWNEAAAPGEMYSKPVQVLPEHALQPFNALLRARARWESM
jgi:hypothetical protein